MSKTDTRRIEIDETEDYWIAPRDQKTGAVNATVVIPAYQAAATLHRAVSSALAQTMHDLEVIVVDDASTDSSWELVLGLHLEDPRLRGIRNKRNGGKPVGMNRAISRARGRWVAVLDADDWFHPDRLAALVSMAEARQADLVADNQFLFDAVIQRIVKTAWASNDTDWNLDFDGFLARSNPYQTFNLGMLKPIVRADFIHQTGLWYDESVRELQDFFYLVQFYMLGGRAVVADSPYYYYTQPLGATSRQWSRAGRRQYDFKTAALHIEKITTAPENRLSAHQQYSLRKKRQQFLTLNYYLRMKECLTAGSVIPAISWFMRRPRMTDLILRRLYGRLKQRFGRSPALVKPGEAFAGHGLVRRP